MSEYVRKTTGKPRGTAAMAPEVRKEVARKGGLSISQNRAHMAEIGRKGGKSAIEKLGREHFSAMGKIGGTRSGQAKREAFCEKAAQAEAPQALIQGGPGEENK